jgi:MoaA/NifB/PqqE/SkfB family radical SAM enzyme
LVQVELITNGTLLTQNMSQRLIEAGLDALWVSLDGATPESYADVRLGATLPEVVANLTCFRDARWHAQASTLFWDYYTKPDIGIVFVAMKRNIADLPSVISLGNRLGAKQFLVSNVLPYTADMRKEILYSRALTDIFYSPWGPSLILPKIDMNHLTRDAFIATLSSSRGVRFAEGNLWESINHCPFIDGGVTAISWEGNVSPCLPLLHSHTSFVDERERFSRRYVVGNVAECNLIDLWNDPHYIKFRERVQTFDFPPCVVCGGCDFSEKNEEDCFGNPFPTCGGCLWAQGVIRCP